MVKTSQGTYAMGGLSYDFRNEVLQLDCPGDQIQSCQWKEMNEKMENGRVGHVAIPLLPESYDICNWTIKNLDLNFFSVEMAE